MSRAHTATQAPGNWAERAECLHRRVSMELPHTNNRHKIAKAAALLKPYCQQCPVLAPCREWALTSPDPATGHVAGGMTPNERARARKAEL